MHDLDLSSVRVKQDGSLRDYQKEFEKLGNRVQGWIQKELMGTFMRGSNQKLLRIYGCSIQIL